MGAPQGNQFAKKERTRVAACLSISDEKDKHRLTWAIRQLEKEGIMQPTDQQVSRFVKDWCYTMIDTDIRQQEDDK